MEILIFKKRIIEEKIGLMSEKSDRFLIFFKFRCTIHPEKLLLIVLQPVKNFIDSFIAPVWKF